MTAFLVLLYMNSLDILYFVFEDQDYNECDKSEQEYNEEEHIYTNYTEGTVVYVGQNVRIPMASALALCIII